MVKLEQEITATSSVVPVTYYPRLSGKTKRQNPYVGRRSYTGRGIIEETSLPDGRD